MSEAIEALMNEERRFEPSVEFVDQALISDASLSDLYARDPQGFWAQQAERVDWIEPWDQVLEWNLPDAKWFLGGKLNASANCLDRHVEAGHGAKVAYHWEGEAGDTRTITYSMLLDEVSQFANALRRLGIGKGDRVAIYLGMVPELPISMLACARIGAIHSVVFCGFSADALSDRMNDSACKAVITSDANWRRGVPVSLKANVDKAMDSAPSIEHCVVVKRTGSPTEMTDGRDHWYTELISDEAIHCDPEPMDAQDLLFLLYTSGTTARPKGIMQATGGYLVQAAYTHSVVFDIHPDTDVYWCAADCGWVTGHSYIVYGPLANLTTSVLYEGTPDYPTKDRFWSIIERYGVTKLYTAPTTIRMFMKWGPEFPDAHDLSSLKLLGSVGEPINPEAWVWYWRHIGRENCPIVDTWWQTETGGIMISPLPGLTTLKPGSGTFALPGFSVDVFDDDGNSVPNGGGGFLVITKPWPGMLRGIWGDPQRYKTTYWDQYPGVYFAGDGAKRDNDGYLWLLGRVDDVMNVSGHRISTTEVESALVDHHAVAEAAVVGRSDATTGQAIAAFVILRAGSEPSEELAQDLRDHVTKIIGPIAKPATLLFTEDLPKTRSGKIMRRLLRDVAEDHTLGDTTTLADPGVVAQIRDKFLAAGTHDED